MHRACSAVAAHSKEESARKEVLRLVLQEAVRVVIDVDPELRVEVHVDDKMFNIQAKIAGEAVEGWLKQQITERVELVAAETTREG